MQRDNFLIVLTILLVIALGLLGYFMFTNSGSSDNTADNGQKTSQDLSKLVLPQQQNKSAENTSEVKAGQTTYALMKTNLGDIKLKLFDNDAPKTVENFVKLSEEGFYNGTKFHRVIPDFMIQGGDPNSKDDDWSNDGTGGPGYKFDDEINSHKLVKGVLAMANSGANTNGSQFFIVTKDATPWLDGKHTAFGEVVTGMDVVQNIEKVATNSNDHPTTDVVITSVDIIRQ